MKKIEIIIFILSIIVIGAGAFYAGMKYQESKIAAMRQNFKNMPTIAGQGQRFFQRGQGNFIAGEVISKDEKSLTIKLPDGSTKIVFYSSSTQITKPSLGSIEDIENGKQIFVSGTQNSDGTYTATVIQIREPK
jgi:hypothetical protein